VLGLAEQPARTVLVAMIREPLGQQVVPQQVRVEPQALVSKLGLLFELLVGVKPIRVD
jgi:hypothetical protein